MCASQVTTQRAETEGGIRLAREGHILKLGIDRPEKRNAMTSAMIEDLARGLTLLETDPDLRCGVIHAIGDHFSSGMDLNASTQGPRPELPPDLVDPFALREPTPRKPIILALRGYSYTVSMSLMLAADIVVAAEDTRLGYFEARHGLMPSLGGVARMVDRLGWGTAMLYLMTGREILAPEAARLNLVQELVPVGEDITRAMEIAAEVAQMAPLAIAAIKRNGRTFLSEGLSVASAEIQVLRQQLITSADAKEAREARREKRSPVFRGN